jgi:hypothetical protein
MPADLDHPPGAKATEGAAFDLFEAQDAQAARRGDAERTYDLQAV